MADPMLRDVEASVASFLINALPLDRVLLGGVIYGTGGLADFLKVSVLEWTPEEKGPATKHFVRGIYRADIYRQLPAGSNPDAFDWSEADRVAGRLSLALSGKRVPIFDVTAADAASRETSQLAVSMSNSDTSATVAGGAVFQEVVKQIVIGGELMTWSSKVTAPPAAVFSGLVRGEGGTVPAAHPANAPVLDRPGDPIGSFQANQAVPRKLGLDQAVERMRLLVDVPFQVSYL